MGGPPPRAVGAPWPAVFRLALRILPFALLTGAAFETVMYYTGFWKVATRKAAERELEARAEVDKLREVSRARRAGPGPGLQ